MISPGRPFEGELHSTNITTATAVPIYESGVRTAYTLKSDEYLEIHEFYFQFTGAGGDSWLIVGADGTPAVGEYITRGSFDALSGVIKDGRFYKAGLAGETLWAKSTNAVAVDVFIHGMIRTVGDNTGVRPTWKENDRGQ